MSDPIQPFEGWQTCTASALKRASRQIGQLYDDVIGPSGLRGTQYALLTQIHRNSGSPLKRLAASMVMDLSALGHSLKPLMRDGFVELVPDEKDRRIKRAKLTKAGICKWEEATLLWQDAHHRFERSLGLDTSKAVRGALNHVSSEAFANAFRSARVIAK